MGASEDDVKASIDQWNRDVNAVNDFLNAATGLIDSGDTDSLSDQAQTA